MSVCRLQEGYHADDIPKSSALITRHLYKQYCFSLPQVMSPNDDPMTKGPTSNNQQNYSPATLDNSPVVPPAPSHQQPALLYEGSIVKYISLGARMSSFTESWPHTVDNQTPLHMALAGFFYTSQSIEYFHFIKPNV